MFDYACNAKTWNSVSLQWGYIVNTDSAEKELPRGRGYECIPYCERV